MEQVSLRQGDAVQGGRTRPIRVYGEAKKPKTSGYTLLRHKAGRARSLINGGKVPKAEISLPLEAAEEIIKARNEAKKWGGYLLESIEDFEAIMSNPEWLVKDRAERVEQIIGTMHSRLTNFKRTLQ